MRARLSLLILPFLLIAGCSVTGNEDAASAESADTGWLGDTSFEVGATISSRVSAKAAGDFADLAENEATQLALVDAQWKFAKTKLKKNGYDLNQLADTVKVTDKKVEGDVVTLTYEAKVDLLRELAAGQSEAPKLAQLEPKTVAVKLPAKPIGAFAEARGQCIDAHDGSPDGDRNFFYYFDAEAPGCAIDLVPVEVKVTEVYERKIVFPEYDKLITEDVGNGKKGFRAAIVPAEGDDDPMSRFDVHKRMLESELRIAPETVLDGKAVRFVYKKANVAIAIDLYDPTKTELTPQFRAALSKYQLVFFNGHSVYGTRDLLTDEASFSDRYQIVMMHSCRSYPYYVRQVFRAKATSEDPTGWANADVVATGESSYPTDSPRTLKPLLEGLLSGMALAESGTGAGAPSWNAIVKKMNERTSGIMYGVAGVRTNEWKPR
jgi:hypothetical protein